MPRPGSLVEGLLAAALLFGGLGTAGIYWDVGWHLTIGRDTFWSPPHLLMYGAVAANGVISFIAEAWALRFPDRLPEFGRAIRGPFGLCLPLGFSVLGLGVGVVLAAAPLDELWHRLYGKEGTVWSFPHLLAVAGAVLMALGIAAAVASRSRLGRTPLWICRLLLALLAADLLEKAMFTLSHYTVDPFSRTPDYYPFLTTLLTAGVAVGAVRALGPGWATISAGIHLALTILAVLLLRAFNFNAPTVSPLLVVPALAVDGCMFLANERRDRWAVAVVAGATFGAVLVPTEALWMERVIGRAWPAGAAVAGLPRVLAAGALSGWVGWAIGGFLRGLAAPGSAGAIFGGPRRARLALAGAVVLSLVGLAGAYRPEPLRPPAPLSEFGLIAGESFDYVDAVFREAALPDEWWRPGRHAIRSEGVVGGLPWPIGPGWCARDEQTLAEDLTRIRFDLRVNGERVALEQYPMVRLVRRDRSVCAWVGVLAATPPPGRQEFIYTITYQQPVSVGTETVGPGATVIVLDMIMKAP